MFYFSVETRKTQKKGATHVIPDSQVKELMSSPIDWNELFADAMLSQLEMRNKRVHKNKK